MPVGRQFRNTFWHDADGNMRASVPNRGADDPTPATFPVELTEGEVDRKSNGEHLQGMLFPPQEATGLKGDSLAGDRRAAISTSLGLDDLPKYRARLGSMIPGQRATEYERDADGRVLADENGSMKKHTTSKRGDRGAREDIQRIIGSVDHTDLPTHIIRGVSAPTVLDPRSGRAYAEDHSGRIRLTTDRRGGGGHWEGGEPVTQPKTTRGAPLVNKNFSAQVGRMEWDSDEGAHGDLVRGGKGNWNPGGVYREEGADVHFFHPETGAEVHPPEEAYSDDFGHIVHSGLHSNIWPGKGTDTDKHITRTFRVYNGISERGGEKFKTFHTRHARVVGTEMEETTTPLQFVKDPVILTTNPATAVHEIGHVRDEATVDSFSHRRSLRHKADPREEGIADGHADRFVRHAGHYEEALDPDAPGRTDQIRSGGGYGIDYHHWKGSPVGKALYAATRVHASMSDGGAASVPSRDSLAARFGLEQPRGYLHAFEAKEMVDIGDKALLGHLYDEHEHVRRALGNLGLDKVGQEAHALYRHLVSKEQGPPEEKWTQQALIQTTKNGQQWVRQDGTVGG